MGYKLTVKGDFAGLSAGVRAGLAEHVKATAGRVAARAVDEIQGGEKSGRLYRRGKKGGEQRVHQASAPGEAPATDEGTLAGSVLPVHEAGSLEARVDVSADHAADLELGNSRIEPRPFLSPAVEAERPGFVAGVGDAINRAAQSRGS